MKHSKANIICSVKMTSFVILCASISGTPESQHINKRSSDSPFIQSRAKHWIHKMMSDDPGPKKKLRGVSGKYSLLTLRVSETPFIINKQHFRTHPLRTSVCALACPRYRSPPRPFQSMIPFPSWLSESTWYVWLFIYLLGCLLLVHN